MEHLIKNNLLDEHEIVRKERIYESSNGGFVERFWIHENGKETSYIFKRFYSSSGISEKEEWVYKQLITSNHFLAPKIIYKDQHCMVLQDLGFLDHSTSEKLLLHSLMALTKIHQLPIDTIPDHFSREELSLERLISFVREHAELSEEEVTDVLQTFSSLPLSRVVSHGDFHTHNLALIENELYILDWDRIQINSVYYDLFYLLDVTSPHFSRDITDELREKVLVQYCKMMEIDDIDDFVLHYYRYAYIHLLWILVLIENDIENGVIHEEKLYRQKKETLEKFHRIGAILKT